MDVNKNEINLDKYIQGELSSDELKEFETLLEKDETLKQRANFNQYADTVLHINLAPKGEKSDIDENLKPILNELGDKYFPEDNTTDTKTSAEKTTASKPTIIRRLFPIATLAAAAAFLLFLFFPNRKNELYTKHFEPAPTIPVQGPSDNLNDFEKANKQYDGKNYKEAIVLYNKYSAKNSGNPYTLLYKGSSHMALNQTGEAINTFQQLATRYPDFGDKANWYLALCYLKKRDEAKTKAFLSRISKDDKNYYNKAQQLLQELP